MSVYPYFVEEHKVRFYIRPLQLPLAYSCTRRMFSTGFTVRVLFVLLALQITDLSVMFSWNYEFRRLEQCKESVFRNRVF